MPMHHTSEDTSALAYLTAIWRRRCWLATALAAAGACATLALVVSLPDIYRASALVLVDTGASQGAVRSPADAEIAPRLYTASQELLSRANLQQVIERFDLYPELRRRLPPQAVLERMRRDVRVESMGVEGQWGRDTTVALSLSYQGWDRHVVADVANLLAVHYVEENRRLRQRQVTDTASFLREQLDAVERQLDERSKVESEYKARYSGELPSQQSANLAILERLNAQLKLNSDAQVRTAGERETLLAELARTDSGGAGVRLAELKLELAQLRTRYSDRYPDVARLRAEIATLEQKRSDRSPGEEAAVRRLRERLTATEATLESLRQEERRLRSTAVAYQNRVERAPQREQELSVIAQDRAAARELHASLLKRYEDVQLAETFEGRQDDRYRVIEPAVAPDLPAGPARLRLLVMGLMLSAALAAAAVAVVEQFDTSFHTLADLREFTRLPVLASVPVIRTTVDTWRAWLARGALAAMALAAIAAAGVLAYLAGAGNRQLVWLLAQRGT